MARIPAGGNTQKRTEIADAALRIIGTKGLVELTMASLAAEVGVTSGALFRHFRSRDEILEEMARRIVERIGASFPQAGLPPWSASKACSSPGRRSLAMRAALPGSSSPISS